jgi:hypothetical protein
MIVILVLFSFAQLISGLFKPSQIRVFSFQQNIPVVPLRALPSQLIAMGDYASEIEKAVGTEVYGPIFQAGLFLFLSGVISATIAGFIINAADSWDDLDKEFQEGKDADVASTRAREKAKEDKKKIRDTQGSSVDNLGSFDI